MRIALVRCEVSNVLGRCVSRRWLPIMIADVFLSSRRQLLRYQDVVSQGGYLTCCCMHKCVCMSQLPALYCTRCLLLNLDPDLGRPIWLRQRRRVIS